ncbi:MAG: PIN domain-containing protein [Chloroflexi bacterium]|nr:PIN domain-containing protein [Chloroflexota bacterium]
MIALLDVNVLIALAWPNHVHHSAARAWFEARREDGWATCPLTEAGFVRVSCNPSVVRHAVTPLEAIAVLQRLSQLGAHTFWPQDQSIMDLPESIGIRLQGYRQVTDAVLLAAAMQRNGQLATLDGGMERLVSESQRASLCVIPV